jgi:hypothetical protein
MIFSEKHLYVCSMVLADDIFLSLVRANVC